MITKLGEEMVKESFLGAGKALGTAWNFLRGIPKNFGSAAKAAQAGNMGKAVEQGAKGAGKLGLGAYGASTLKDLASSPK